MPTTPPQPTVPRRATLDARVPGGHATARDLLGAEHPLARTEARVRTLLQQSTAVLTFAALAGFAWLIEPGGPYPSLLAAAAVVQAALAVALVLAVHAERDAVLRLIAEGRGGLPLATVARVRHTLLRPQRRERLGRSVEKLRGEVARPLRGPLPLYSRAVIQSVDGELARVVRLLRAPTVSADGVAMAVLLLSSDSSPLYGDDAERLRDELGRLTFILARGAA